MKRALLPPVFLLPILLVTLVQIPQRVSAGQVPTAQTEPQGTGSLPVIGQAEDLLRSRHYTAAVDRLNDVIREQPENGYAEWLRAVALQAAGKTEEAAAACAVVPEALRWHRKARLLKARALTDLKRFAEAETIYAEEAARALSPARKDVLAGQLAAFADELGREPSPGEADAVPANPQAAARLYQKALEVDFLTPDFTDETLIKLALSLRKAGQPENALQALDDYLVQFDAGWTPLSAPETPLFRSGAQGDAGLKPEKPRDAKRFLKTGKRVAEARLRITECLCSRPDWAPALKQVDALLALQPAPDTATLAAAAWLRCRIIGGPRLYAKDFSTGSTQSLLPPPADGQREQRQQTPQRQQSRAPLPQQEFPPTDHAAHNEALRAFLTAWPADAHAPEAACLIGTNLLALGKTDEGLNALTDFTEGRGYQFDPAAPDNHKPDPASGLTPLDVLNRAKQETVFRIGQVGADRKNYAAAMDRWRDYTVNFPNGAQWAAAQQGIIDAEFQLGIAAVAAGEEKEAREKFDAFLTKYPLDGRARQILFIYGQMPWAAAQVKELHDREKAPGQALPAETLDLFRAAISEWSRLITKYPQSEEASLALYNTALILSEKLDRPEEGLAAFRRLTWGQWAALAKERAGILEEKSLAISAPRVFRTDEEPRLAVSLRNIKKVKVSRYALDLESWLRSAHQLGGLEKLDVDLIAPEKSWEVETTDYTPLRSLQRDIPIPFPDNAAGACVVRLEGEGWQATTLVVRSDIELITEATRGELLVLALNTRENKPAAGAAVLVSDGASVIGSGKTAEDGVFRFTKESLPSTVRAFVLTPQGSMVSGLDLTGLTVTKQPGTITHTTFDRTVYYPGQTAKFLTFQRTRKDGPVKPAAGKITLRILAPDNRLVLARPAEWAADGTVNGSFDIPAKAPEGDYKAQLLDSADAVLVSANFAVKEMPSENTPLLSLKLSTSIVKPGGVLKATLLADWPWGLPVMDEEVEITFPDGRTERRKTDSGGVLQFDLNASASTSTEWRQESVRLRLPRQPSTEPVTGAFTVTTSEGTLKLLETPDVVRSGDTVRTKVRARNYDNSPAARAVTATLYRLTAPPPSRVLEGLPWISYNPPPVKEEQVESQTLNTDAATGEVDCVFKTREGGHYVVRVKDEGTNNPNRTEGVTDADKQTVTSTLRVGKLMEPVSRAFYVSGNADPHGLRLYAGFATLNEGATASLQLHSVKPRQQVLITASADHFLSHQVLSIPEGLTEIPVTVSAAHAPNFRVTAAAMEGRNLCAASASFIVRQGLKPALKTPAKPGEEPALEITDLSGRPVAASTLRVLVRTSPDPDAGLQEHGPHSGFREILPLLRHRDLTLAIHTSADLMFPGSSVKVQEPTGNSTGGSVTAANDQQRIIEVRNQEFGFNSGNTLLLTDNKVFSDLNCFIQTDQPGSSASTGGSLRFGAGVRRGADSLIQSTLLPAIPDAAEAWGMDASAPSSTPFPETAGPVLFTNRTNPDQASTEPPAQTFGAAAAHSSRDLPGDCESWNGENFQGGVLSGLSQADGRWMIIVRAWTPDSGMTEAALPFVWRNALQAKVLARSLPEAAPLPSSRSEKAASPGSSLMVLLNRGALTGEATIRSTAGTVKVNVDGSRLRQVVEVPEGLGWNAVYGVSLKQGDQDFQTQAQGHTKSLMVFTKPGHPSTNFTATAGGVLRAEDKVELNLSGIASNSPISGQAAIFRTPAELLQHLANRTTEEEEEEEEELPDPAFSIASELQARLTLIRRWRAGPPEQKQKVEDGLEGCRYLVSALALSEQSGGWAWGGLDIAPDVLTTAQNWQVLWEARQAGITVSEKLRGRVEKFLTANYAGIPADDYEKKAAVLHAMAATGLADYANAAPLLRVRAQLSDSALAFLTAALIRMERPDEARQLLTILESRAQRGRVGSTIETASWKGSTKIVRLSEPALVTAMVLWSTARLAPDSPLGQAAVNSLLNSPVMNRRLDPLSLGPVASAMDAWFTGARDWTEPGEAGVLAKDGPVSVDASNGQLVLPLVKDLNVFTIRPAAGKQVIFSVVLSGLPRTLTDPKPWPHPEIVSRRFFHRGLTFSAQPLNATGTSQVKSVEIGQTIRVEVKLKSTGSEARHPQYLVWDEPLPSGFVLIPGSLEGNWDRLDISPERLRLTYGPGVIEPLKYELMAVVPGPCKARAAVIADPCSPEKYRVGPETELTVMPPGTKSPDVYGTNQAEHFELARLTFDSGNSAECLKHLDALAPSARKPEFEKDLARMRLWLLTDTPDGDAAQIVQAFETLNERHPALVIPFDRILRVGAAYQKIGEHERGGNVFSAALEANFLADSGISAALEDLGDYAGSVDFQEALWFDAPDSADARGALFALSQGLFRNASKAADIPVRRGHTKLEKTNLLNRSRDLLNRFTAFYPGDDLADDAAFSLTSVFFALKDYVSVTNAAEAAVKRYPDSVFLGQFQYMAALGHFWQFHYAEALAAAAPVANGGSKDRDLARYITGQIYHAEGKPAEAVDWYRRVKEKYPDAADALAAFEEKKISVPEITTFAPGDAVKLTVSHRNVREASLQVYKVDLMKLYLREKNLSRITSVNLAGIAPEASVPLDTANAAAWTDHEAEVTLPMKDEGAYLVIARGDDLFTSGLVLITALKLDVRQESGRGALRVTVRNAADGKYVADAEVKAIANQSSGIQSGQTDPRGIWEAEALWGIATVIVRQGDNRYAFHRGITPMAPFATGGYPVTPPTPQSSPTRDGRFPTEFDPPQIPQSFGGTVLSKDAYLRNLEFDNGQIQEGNLKNWDTKRRAAGKGVQADKALKK